MNLRSGLGSEKEDKDDRLSPVDTGIHEASENVEADCTSSIDRLSPIDITETREAAGKDTSLSGQVQELRGAWGNGQLTRNSTLINVRHMLRAEMNGEDDRERKPEQLDDRRISGTVLHYTGRTVPEVDKIREFFNDQLVEHVKIVQGGGDVELRLQFKSRGARIDASTQVFPQNDGRVLRASLPKRDTDFTSCDTNVVELKNCSPCMLKNKDMIRSLISEFHTDNLIVNKQKQVRIFCVDVQEARLLGKCLDGLAVDGTIISAVSVEE